MRTCVLTPGRTPLPIVLYRNRHALAFLGVMAFALMAVMAGIYHVDRDRETIAALTTAQYRIRQQDAQLALYQTSGDCGVLLANLTTDMGPSQLRLVPRGGQ